MFEDRKIHPHRFAFCLLAPRVRGATSFFQASDLVHHQALRPTDEEDARCVQPTSATQTISTCTRTSRVPDSLSATFAAGDSLPGLGPRRESGEGTFHDVRTASADRHTVRVSSSTASRPGVTSVGVFFPRYECDRASDIPVAGLRSPSRLTELPRCCLFPGRTSFFAKGWCGSEGAKTAETTVHAGP